MKALTLGTMYIHCHVLLCIRMLYVACMCINPKLHGYLHTRTESNQMCESTGKYMEVSQRLSSESFSLLLALKGIAKPPVRLFRASFHRKVS